MYGARHDITHIAGPSCTHFAAKAEFLVEESIRRAHAAGNWTAAQKWNRIQLRMMRFAESPGPMRPAVRAR